MEQFFAGNVCFLSIYFPLGGAFANAVLRHSKIQQLGAKAPLRLVSDADRRLFPTSEITGVGNSVSSPRPERLSAGFFFRGARGLAKVLLIASGTIFTRISKVSGLKCVWYAWSF